MKFKLWPDAILAGVALSILGFVIGYFCGKGERPTLGMAINASDLIQIGISLLVFVLVRIVATRQIGDERAEKELLVELFKDASAQLNEVDSAYSEIRDEDPIRDPGRLQGALKRFSNSIQLIESSIQACKRSPHEVNFEDIKDCRGRVKDILTDGRFPSRFEPGTQREWDVESTKMRGLLAKAMLMVNKS
jgi:hypothetical protein